MQWRNLVLFLAAATILPGATIHLKSRDVETRPDREDYRGGQLKRRTLGKSHYLLQFKGPIGQDQLDDLASRGAIVTSSIPDGALMVAAGDDFSPAELDIEWAGRLRPADKLSFTLDKLASNRPGVFVVEFHSDADMGDARRLVLEAGLAIVEHPNLMSNQLLATGAAGAVSALSGWDEVAYILPASDDLIAGNEVIACAGALTSQGSVAQYVKIGHGWPADGPNGVQLKYFFDTLTEKVPPLTVKAEIERAFQEWMKYAKVEFIPGTSAAAPRTVRVLFARGNHGDPYPFDGPGVTLAHTFYPAPPNPEALAGDMHLDSDENWHSGANIDIYTVALHETGHALGLGHSDKPGAIMYPYYRLGAAISQDDIAGIRELYGAAEDGGNQPAGPNPSLLTLTVRSPPAPVETASATLAVSGSTADGVGETKVVWQTDHGAAGLATGSADWFIGAVPLVAGMNTITLTATDAAHHTVSRTVEATRKIPAVPDKTPPSLAVTSPSLTIVSTISPRIEVRGTASDNVGVVKVTWQNSLGGSQGVAVGTSDWSADIPLNPGTNTLILRAFDDSGNNSWRSLTVIRR